MSLLCCLTISFDCNPSCCGFDRVVLCLAVWVLIWVYFIKTYLFGKSELHQEAAGASKGINKTISSKQSTVKASSHFLPPPTKPFFARKWRKNAKNLSQVSVFWVWVVAWCPHPPPILRVLDPKKMCSIPLKPQHNCFRCILPYLCRSGQKLSNVHNLQFDIELNDFTACHPIFYQECLKFTLPEKSDSKYLPMI